MRYVNLPRDFPSWPWALVYGVCALVEGAWLVLTVGIVDIDLPAWWCDLTDKEDR